ncbi:MAG: GNAT family N-acetyltransferase [Proteobacteria bacterium]|nr:GNAT family N-acetyltransferase [Pseudomonadota bacterium]
MHPEFRRAQEEDLVQIVRLLADDPLGAKRERLADPLPAVYARAFQEIARQHGNEIIVAILDGEIAGVLQLTVIAGLARQGMRRAQIEGVRIAARHRGKGLGEALMNHAIERARGAGCGLVQLTTDRSRSEAHQFYARLGFVDSHLGLKLSLEPH